MSRHTPGPWVIVNEPYPHFRGPNGHAVWARDVGSDADMRLIAAAPRMLEALQRGHRKLATFQSVYTGDKELRSLLTEWKAAIAQATGEKP
jgi:hypothetical protein